MKITRPILIWDWDGTLVDTIGYKYEGIWRDVFFGEKEKQEAVINFLKTLGGRGINRYGLIKHALMSTYRPELVNTSNDELMEDIDIKSYAKKYKKFSEESVVKVGTFSDTKKILESLYNDNYSMYIISGGGTDEDLKRMAKNLEIAKYFKDIFGFGFGDSTSFSKIENFKRIEKIEGVSELINYIVIGDSVSDYDFSKDIGAKFIGFIREWNKWEGYEKKLDLINDVSFLESKIKEI